MLVLCQLEAAGTLRFSAIKARIDDIPLRVLTRTLRRLEQDGLISRGGSSPDTHRSQKSFVTKEVTLVGPGVTRRATNRCSLISDTLNDRFHLTLEHDLMDSGATPDACGFRSQWHLLFSCRRINEISNVVVLKDPSSLNSVVRLSRRSRSPLWFACIATFLFCVGCEAQSEDSGNGGMFTFFKDKRAAKSATAVHADVGAPLVREASFPGMRPTAASARVPRQLALDGVPPQGSLLEQPIAGQTTTAYVTDASHGRAPLALVNINVGRPHIEVWELGPGNKLLFVRKKTVRLDPEQDSWSGFLLAGVAYLADSRLLLAVFYYAPHVKQALFVYDSASDSYTKIANVVPHTDDRQKFFEAQLVAPDAIIVQYYTGHIRLAPEVYYNTPSHLRLFAPRYPQGIELLQLSAADGSVERWAVIDKTLWLEARDTRERHKPKEFIWSLNLGKVLPP